MELYWKHSLPLRDSGKGIPYPFLFLFVADGLSNLLQKEVCSVESPQFGCVGDHREFHILFDADTLLFFPGSVDEASKVKDIVEVYANGTGKLINPAKCSIIFRRLGS